MQLELPLEAPTRRARRRARVPSRRHPEALTRLALWLARRLRSERRVRGLEVEFNGRLRSAAGRADFSARRIELNPRLLDRHPEELVPTLVHELCHFIAGARAGHGPRWRDAVVALGQVPESCHRLDVDGLAVRRRRWLWSCGRCGETYERGHRAAHRYSCGRCGRRLRLDGQAPSE
jgi:predicted SprT family Zn-dependent metalloprotease